MCGPSTPFRLYPASSTRLRSTRRAVCGRRGDQPAFVEGVLKPLPRERQTPGGPDVRRGLGTRHAGRGVGPPHRTPGLVCWSNHERMRFRRRPDRSGTRRSVPPHRPSGGGDRRPPLLRWRIDDPGDQWPTSIRSIIRDTSAESCSVSKNPSGSARRGWRPHGGAADAVCRVAIAPLSRVPVGVVLIAASDGPGGREG